MQLEQVAGIMYMLATGQPQPQVAIMEITLNPTTEHFEHLPQEVRSFANIVLAPVENLVCGELSADFFWTSPGESTPGIGEEFKTPSGDFYISLHILDGQAFLTGTLNEPSGCSFAFGIHTKHFKVEG